MSNQSEYPHWKIMPQRKSSGFIFFMQNIIAVLLYQLFSERTLVPERICFPLNNEAQNTCNMHHNRKLWN